MFADAIRILLARFCKPAVVCKKGRRFRPGLESLEQRECPAVFNPIDAPGLIAAITTANANNQPDVINLQAGTTYTLTSALPNIVLDNGNTANTLTINGNGATINQTDNTDRVFNIVGGRLFLSYATISGGNPNGFGGGIRVFDSTTNTLDNLVLRNSLVTANTAAGVSDGGGIFFSTGGKGTIINSTISGNRANDNGGGISMLAGAGTVTIVNSTIARNFTINGPGPNMGSGGGINVEGGTLNITNTIVSDNHLVSLNGTESDLSRSGTSTVNSRSSLYLETPTTGVGNTINGLNTGNVFGKNPLLGTLKYNGGLTNTQAIISAASPAINAGDSTQLSAPDNVNDQRGPGFNRIIGGGVDIGAFEFQPPAVAVGLASNPNPALVGQLVTFTATVTGTATNSNIPQGTVTFLIDGVATATVALSNGSASFATAALQAGRHTIQAVYNPTVVNDYAFAAGASSDLFETVQALPVPPVPPSPLSPIGRRWRR